jgi:glutathione S-transferase
MATATLKALKTPPETPEAHQMQIKTSHAVLTISSKNYGAWSLRGWLLVKLAGLAFDEHIVATNNPAMKAEMLLLSSSMLVPSLQHGDVKVWDTLAIAEYLNEIKPEARLLPSDVATRAHCRAICGEIHSGFVSMRSSIPMNIRAHFPQSLVQRAGRCGPCAENLDRLSCQLRRPLPVWQRDNGGRCHVRPRGDALFNL